MAQLTFQWPASASYAPEDFITGTANKEAVHFLENWPNDEPPYAALLSGPEASGKTHLALGWAGRHQAIAIPSAALGSTDSASLWQGARLAVLENIHTITDETALFHLLRHSESHGLYVLLTARMSAKQLPFTLADLRSRLLSLPSAAIEPPDETLLKAFLFKCFTDRQLRVGEEVIDYLVKRMERSFLSARALTEAVEQHALETKRDITVPLVKDILK